MWMNEYEIDEARERFANHPVLGPATQFLSDFRDEVNRNSDGWPYWKPAGDSAKRLMELIHGHLRAGMGAEPTEADVLKTLGPIKGFMTRRGYAAGMRLPQITFDHTPVKHGSDSFEALCGGVDKAQRLLSLYTNSHPCGTALDFLYDRGRTKEQVFALAARREGFTTRQIEALLRQQEA